MRGEGEREGRARKASAKGCQHVAVLRARRSRKVRGRRAGEIEARVRDGRVRGGRGRDGCLRDGCLRGVCVRGVCVRDAGRRETQPRAAAAARGRARARGTPARMTCHRDRRVRALAIPAYARAGLRSCFSQIICTTGRTGARGHVPAQRVCETPGPSNSRRPRCECVPLMPHARAVRPPALCARRGGPLPLRTTAHH